MSIDVGLEFANWSAYLRERDPEGYAQMLALTEAERALAFGLPLAFGTGGLRGVMGMGVGRMNRYTVARVTDGLASVVLADENRPKSCAIACDTRLHSREFAEIAAGVLCARGVKTYLFSEAAPTPALSHAVRSLGCGWGVVITASHNPKEYNGYKVYDARGVQLLECDAENISKSIENIPMFTSAAMPLAQAEARGLLVMLGDAQKERYLRDVLSALDGMCVPKCPERDVRIVYSALYGAGAKYVPQALALRGFADVCAVQTAPDGAFGGMQKPNPEVRAVYKRALEEAKRVGAQLVLATDPDCDRVGVYCERGGEYVPLTGNQVGALLCDYLLSLYKTDEDYIVTTIVSGDLGVAVAEDLGARVYRTLTGFKYIGDIAERAPGRFVLGYEESLGYLTGGAARDKDGVLACTLIASMAAHWRAAGSDLIGRLADLTARYGAYADRLISMPVEGADFSARISRLMRTLREAPERALDGFSLVAVEDYLRGGELPRSDVLKLRYAGGAWVAARPSGTEPQIKFYFSARGQDAADAQNTLDCMEAALRRAIMAIHCQ